MAEELQSLKNVVSGCGKDFEVKFSSEKSKIKIVYRSEDESNTTWRLKGNDLQQTPEYKYVGMWMSTKLYYITKSEKTSMMNQSVDRL